VQGSVRRAAHKAGLFNNGPHMLRHTFCRIRRCARDSGCSINPIAKHFVEIYWQRRIAKI